MSILIQPEQTWFDNNGNLLANGLVYTYAPGTSTPVATYQDEAQTVLNENPVPIGVDGRTIMYGSGNFRFIVKDVNGVTIYDQDTASYLESSAISTAMLPVVSATTLTLARTAMGIDGQLTTALAAVSLVTGPTGPVGPIGPQGIQGAQGPIGPTGAGGGGGGGGGIWDGTGTPPVGSYIISQFQDFNSSDITPFGTAVGAALIQPVPQTMDGTWRHCGPASTSFLGDIYLHFFLALRIA